MTITIGLVANIYNEVNALPGWLETHTPFFDDVRILHSGPQGQPSNDGTLELLERWKIPVEFCAIDEGFGAVRTRAIHSSPCDWVMILDADERFFPLHRVMYCEGEATPHSEVDRILQAYDFRDLSKKERCWESIAQLGANLKVNLEERYNQGEMLRSLISSSNIDAIATVRRHWHDLEMTRPTQNWHIDADWQARIVKNDERIMYDAGTRMHERLIGISHIYPAHGPYGPFFDHFHFSFKKLEHEQRAHDVAVYDAINQGKTPPTWEEFKQENGI